MCLPPEGPTKAAEAFTALTLDKLSTEILARSDLSEWTKAQMLSDNLQKFLSHKSQAFPEESAMPPLPPLPPSAPPMPPVSDEKGSAIKQPEEWTSNATWMHCQIKTGRGFKQHGTAVMPTDYEDPKEAGSLGGVEKYRRAQATSLITAEAQRLLN
ncbi:hypothetical protein RvY_19130 [Ramazzottius varieornatus]|uniref:Uncharacterized protein n=1 Tax=Ramazzottius varieornatus TaxID=947166 RepID=A0A1D1W8F7_RAMVA|nr:hypothetical protein RvY_19130 [Ramazzottius varieornatus]